MKRILYLLFAVSILWSCNSDYDDSALTGRVDDLENRVAKLEELCKQMNTTFHPCKPLSMRSKTRTALPASSPLPRMEK